MMDKFPCPSCATDLRQRGAVSSVTKWWVLSDHSERETPETWQCNRCGAVLLKLSKWSRSHSFHLIIRMIQWSAIGFFVLMSNGHQPQWWWWLPLVLMVAIPILANRFCDRTASYEIFADTPLDANLAELAASLRHPESASQKSMEAMAEALLLIIKKLDFQSTALKKQKDSVATLMLALVIIFNCWLFAWLFTLSGESAEQREADKNALLLRKLEERVLVLEKTKVDRTASTHPNPPWAYRPEPPAAAASALVSMSVTECPCSIGIHCADAKAGKYCVEPSGAKRYGTN